MAKNPKRRLRLEADKLWYSIIIENYPFCESCGKEKSIQAHHFYYKSSCGHLRYDLDNGIGLGLKCHFLLHHHDPKLIEEKIIGKRGQKWLNALKRKAYQKPTSSYQTLSYYKNIIEKLKKVG